MYEQDFKQDGGVVSLAIHAKGDSKRFTFWGRVTHRKVGPHDTEAVWCTLARNSSVMYGIVLRVTPHDTLRKMNSDNIVCSTLTSNIMNGYELWYDMFMLDYEVCISLCIKARLWIWTVNNSSISPIVQFRTMSWMTYV